MRAPAGFYPLSQMYPHVLGAGCILLCLHCGTEARAPLPRLHPALYSQACDRFIAAHRGCQDRVELFTRGAA